jgi:hypothetical protein
MAFVVTPKVNVCTPLKNARVSLSKPGPPVALVRATVSPGLPDVGVTPPPNTPGTTVICFVVDTLGPVAVMVALPGDLPWTVPIAGSGKLATPVALDDQTGSDTPVITWLALAL